MRRLVMTLRAGPPADQPSHSRRLITLPDAAGAEVLLPWVKAVTSASSACVVIDADANVAAISAPAADLLSSTPDEAVERPLQDLLDLVDFHTGAPTRSYLTQIPPLAALATGIHARSILRVAQRAGHLTLDAVAAPILGTDKSITGAITFLSPVTGAS